MMIPFLTAELAAEVREPFGTPCYVYDRAALERTARRRRGQGAIDRIGEFVRSRVG